MKPGVPDERPFRAERMLERVIEQKSPRGGSTREAIEAFFDHAQKQAHERTTDRSPLLTWAADTHPNQPAAAATATGSISKNGLPTTPPIEVPNHELLRCLAAGGFGQVWIARSTVTGHYRACKLIPADKAVELDGLRHLKQKVPHHQNLFPIEDVGHAGDWIYALMPLASPASSDLAVQDTQTYEPMTLRTYLDRRGPRPADEVARIGSEIAAGIAHLHSHGVTHGDIKPANIMRLGEAWTLADYGMVNTLRFASVAGATPPYVPPEGPGGRQADQFALGVVLMELLTNRPPQALADFRKEQREKSGKPRDHAALVEIVLRATEDEPDDRYGSIENLASALHRIAERTHRVKLATAAATAALFVVLAGLWFASRDTPAVKATAQHGGDAAIPPVVSSAPLNINAFDVRHYRYYPHSGELVTLGLIDAENDIALDDDWLSVHASFSVPAHAYLISLDADGQVRLRWPESPDQPPSATPRLDFPCDPLRDPDGPLFHLDNKPGTQGFLLIASEDPLPPWSSWIEGRGLPTWSPDELPTDGVVLFDGTRTRHLQSTTRGEVRARPGQLIIGPIDWARALSDIPAVRFVGFRVREQAGEP